MDPIEPTRTPAGPSGSRPPRRRPLGRVTGATVRPGAPARPRRRARATRSQWLFAAIAIVVVLALVGSLLGTVVVDFANSRNDDNGQTDPRDFTDQNAQLVASQREVVAANPDDAAAAALLAQYLQLGGNTTEAVQYYEQALALTPDDENVRLNFGDMLAQAGRQTDAELQFQRILGTTPSNSQALFRLGDLYQNWDPTPRTAEAVALFRQVIAVDPTAFLAETAQERLVLLGAATPALASPAA